MEKEPEKNGYIYITESLSGTHETNTTLQIILQFFKRICLLDIQFGI